MFIVKFWSLIVDDDNLFDLAVFLVDTYMVCLASKDGFNNEEVPGR